VNQRVSYAVRIEQNVRVMRQMAEAATRRGQHAQALKYYAQAVGAARSRQEYVKTRDDLSFKRYQSEMSQLVAQMELAAAYVSGDSRVEVHPQGRYAQDCYCMEEPDEQGKERVVTHSSECPKAAY